jgi:hypothetical protein
MGGPKEFSRFHFTPPHLVLPSLPGCFFLDHGTFKPYITAVSINEVAAIILVVLGAVISAVAGIWYLVVMFRESIWWGFGQIFCGIGIIFLFVHWEDAWKPFFTIIAGNLMVFFGIFLSPGMLETVKALEDGNTVYSESAEQPYWQDPDNLEFENQPGAGPDGYNFDQQQGQPADTGAGTAPTAEELRRKQEEALRKQQERYGTFTLSGVLEVDPATLTTQEQIRRYAQGLKFKKEDLLERRRLLDRNDAPAVADLKKDIALLKKRSAEFKKAVADFKANGPPEVNTTGPAEVEDEDFDPGSFY